MNIKRVKTLVVLCLFFGLGWATFSIFSWRFGYHPGDIQLAGAKQALTSVIEACYSGNDGARTSFMVCAQKQLIPEVSRWGVRAFMRALEESQNESSAQDIRITQCHDLSHAIGGAGVYKSRTLTDVLPACSNTCVYGCQHGAVAAWFALGNDIRSRLGDLCDSGMDWSNSPQGRGGCFHEVGHAVASLAGNDIIQSLRLCDELPIDGRLDCGYGVFMELFEPATFATVPIPLPANHPFWCEDLWSPYKEYCYGQAGVNHYGKYQDDDQAFLVCKQVPSSYQEGCFHNLGTNIFYVYQYKSNQAGEIYAFCQRMGEVYVFPCIKGALLSSVMAQGDARGAVSICMNLSEEQKTACFEALGVHLSDRKTTQEKQAICEGLPSDWERVCMSTTTTRQSIEK